MELETIETDYYLHLMRLSASGNEQSGSLKANDAEIFKRLKQLYPDDKKCFRARDDLAALFYANHVPLSTFFLLETS